MVSIASRASWGARHADGDLTLTGLAVEVFAHHTVTAHLAPGATVAAEQAQMRHIEQIGQARFGRGISYNVCVFPSGRAYQGVSWNRRGTHTGGRNSTSRSIAFPGNYETAHLTAAQVNTAAAILAHGRGRWWTGGAPLRAHRDVSATACPGRHVMARLDDIRRGGVGPGLPDIPDEESDDPRRPLYHLVHIDPAVDGRWFLITYRWGIAQRLWNGTQLDLVRRDASVYQVRGPQPPSALAGLTIRGE